MVFGTAHRFAADVSGRFNVSTSAIATAQGVGASLSAAVAGWIVVGLGYNVAFWTLAAIAAAGFSVYLVAMPETAPGLRANPRQHLRPT
jgi:MFS family permease